MYVNRKVQERMKYNPRERSRNPYVQYRGGNVPQTSWCRELYLQIQMLRHLKLAPSVGNLNEMGRSRRLTRALLILQKQGDLSLSTWWSVLGVSDHQGPMTTKGMRQAVFPTSKNHQRQSDRASLFIVKEAQTCVD